MSKTIEHKVKIEVFDHLKELSADDQSLVYEAMEALNKAYAPYSQFYVGAAIRLTNGNIIRGNNQENVAYPSGLCAERVAIYYASASFPNQEIESIAIVAKTKNFELTNPITPCGACRQAIAEYELKQEKPIKIIMSVENGETYICDGIKTLLPFAFNEKDLKKE